MLPILCNIFLSMYCSKMSKFTEGDSLYKTDPNLLYLSKLSRCNTFEELVRDHSAISVYQHHITLLTSHFVKGPTKTQNVLCSGIFCLMCWKWMVKGIQNQDWKRTFSTVLQLGACHLGSLIYCVYSRESAIFICFPSFFILFLKLYLKWNPNSSYKNKTLHTN